MKCVCGHLDTDHHRSWFPLGTEWIEECEFYGYNEVGGMKAQPTILWPLWFLPWKLRYTWVNHCFAFTPV